jgi:hypothetical protein
MLVAMLRIRKVHPANSKPADAMPQKGPASIASTARTFAKGTNLLLNDTAYAGRTLRHLWCSSRPECAAISLCHACCACAASLGARVARASFTFWGFRG